VDQLWFYKNAVSEGPPPELDHLIIQPPVATASKVLENLWQGSAPPIGDNIGRYFDCMVLSAVEYQLGNECFPNVELAHAELYDHGSPITWDQMQQAVRMAGKVIRWLRDGKRVLVTCHMGLNRSGLIVALALCCGYKYTPDQAISMIRQARGQQAMGNSSFRAFLKAFHEGRITAPKL